MAKAPAFQFYASDFLTGTAHFSAEEVGIYIRLLSASWVQGALPLAPDRLARLAGVTAEAFALAWPVVAAKWVELEAGGGYVNERLERQRASQAAYAEGQAAKAGRRWAKARGAAAAAAGADAGADAAACAAAVAVHVPDVCSSIFDLRSSSSNHDPKTDTARARDDGEPLSTVPPAWGQRRAPATVLGAGHHRCAAEASAACARGVCVPGFLVEAWRRQFGDDMHGADAAIRAFVVDEVARLAPGPIGDEPLRFWRAAWQARHGSQAPAGASATLTAAQYTQRSVDAVKARLGIGGDHGAGVYGGRGGSADRGLAPAGGRDA
jgi:uncharacterized protein YdaU (DUF1376 family)